MLFTHLHVIEKDLLLRFYIL